MSTDPQSPKMISDTQEALLNYAKNECIKGAGKDWRSVAQALHPIYGFTLSLAEVMRVSLVAYEQCVNEPRFELAGGTHALHGLLLAPISGPHAVIPQHQATLETTLSIEAFYNAILGHILSAFCTARADWLRAA